MLLSTDQINRLLCLLATWDRETLHAQIQSYRSDFPVDLSDEYLGRQPLDRVRHLFFALCVQNRRLPDAARDDAFAMAG